MRFDNSNDINEENIKISELIRDDADKLNIPKSLEEMEFYNQKTEGVRKKKSFRKKVIYSIAGFAACFVLVVSSAHYIADNPIGTLQGGKNYSNVASAMATGYEEIYETISAVIVAREGWSDEYVDAINDIASGIADATSPFYMGKSISDATGNSESGKMNSGMAIDTADSAATESSLAENDTEEYYNTNEQTENVHEGDVVKTDGKYIYTLKTNYYGKAVVNIVKVNGEKLEKAGKIKIDVENDGYLSEMYVKDDRLIILGYYYEDDGTEEYEDALYCYSHPSYSGTIIYIYDISDRSNGKLLNTLKQDGYLNNSRLAGDYLYVTSIKTIYEVTLEECVPYINGNKMPYEDVYLPSGMDAREYLIISSVNVENPTDYSDTKAIPSGNASMYMSQENIYMAITDSVSKDASNTNAGKHILKNADTKEKNVKMKKSYKKYVKAIAPNVDIDKVTAKEKVGLYKYYDETEIIKISYDDGKLTIEAEGKFEGYIEDNLSLDEYKGYLRAVSTLDAYYETERRITFYDENGNELGYINDYGEIEDLDYTIADEALDTYERYNNVYVLGSDMCVVAAIEELAEDEEIYSSRFMGDYGYFVTYRNTDPLFAVDFSDMENPKIIGELKIPGFSDYLHFYSEDLLLGMGMDTNELTGSWECMKLEMYDISNGNAEVAHKEVINEIDYCESLEDYNSIMVSPKMNLIGFVGMDFFDEERYYYVYEYDEEKGFNQIIKSALKGYEETRGLYIGEYLYIVEPSEGITVIYMKDYSTVDYHEF